MTNQGLSAAPGRRTRTLLGGPVECTARDPRNRAPYLCSGHSTIHGWCWLCVEMGKEVNCIYNLWTIAITGYKAIYQFFKILQLWALFLCSLWKQYGSCSRNLNICHWSMMCRILQHFLTFKVKKSLSDMNVTNVVGLFVFPSSTLWGNFWVHVAILWSVCKKKPWQKCPSLEKVPWETRQR